jgi:hypothetical protein
MKRNVLSLAPVVGNCYKFQSLPSHLLASRSSRRSTKTLTFGFSFTYQGWNNFPLAILRITKTIMRNICLPPGLSKDMDMTHGRGRLTAAYATRNFVAVIGVTHQEALPKTKTRRQPTNPTTAMNGWYSPRKVCAPYPSESNLLNLPLYSGGRLVCSPILNLH